MTIVRKILIFLLWSSAFASGSSLSPSKRTLTSANIKDEDAPFPPIRRGGLQFYKGGKSPPNAQHAIATARSSADNMIVPSVVVGMITAVVGFVYGKILSLSVKTIWEILPRMVVQSFGSINSMAYITATCTMGGLLMGALSARFGNTFSVGDFVAAFSSFPVQSLPPFKVHFLPLLLLSLVTSAFGFSVGPEAPMVCAGALLGAAAARRWYGLDDSAHTRHRHEVLAYAGAAGALTAFMGIPVAGSVFVLELTRSSVGMHQSCYSALSPAVMASIAALVLIRGVLVPSVDVGGHFEYGAIGKLNGLAMIATSLVTGVGGALIGTCFHKTVKVMKKVAWKSNSKQNTGTWGHHLTVKTTIGLFVGLISSLYPQTLFWGEGSLQCMIDGQQTAFASTKHGLVDLLTSSALVDPSVPFASASVAAQVGFAKLVAIALACAGKFPGGIIFPLFFAAAPIAHACGAAFKNDSSNLLPVSVMCLMASTQASVTRTPLATVLILSLTSSPYTELSVMLPACFVSSYIGVYISELLSNECYFEYGTKSNEM